MPFHAHPFSNIVIKALKFHFNRVSLPMWAMANLLSLVVSFYAGVLFIVTGALMLISTIIWSTLRWGSWPMTIVFQDGTLEPYLGGSFYLVLSGGNT